MNPTQLSRKLHEENTPDLIHRQPKAALKEISQTLQANATRSRDSSLGLLGQMHGMVAIDPHHSVICLAILKSNTRKV